ncbi:transposase [Arthrobacter sp. NPDC058130]|uniref:transposase n=1 Tax=Arthrobacter sp. NPDC058130 TaxID=3346353 RepID=UPI0036E31D7A
MIYRYRCGAAWRDVPAEFGPWQTIWRRHPAIWRRRDMGQDLCRAADGWRRPGRSGLAVSVDSTVNRAHQHGTNLPAPKGPVDLHESVG